MTGDQKASWGQAQTEDLEDREDVSLIPIQGSLLSPSRVAW